MKLLPLTISFVLLSILLWCSGSLEDSTDKKINEKVIISPIILDTQPIQEPQDSFYYHYRGLYVVPDIEISFIVKSGFSDFANTTLSEEQNIEQEKINAIRFDGTTVSYDKRTQTIFIANRRWNASIQKLSKKPIKPSYPMDQYEVSQNQKERSINQCRRLMRSSESWVSKFQKMIQKNGFDDIYVLGVDESKKTLCEFVLTDKKGDSYLYKDEAWANGNTHDMWINSTIDSSSIKKSHRSQRE